jgi:hypothetical protein
MMSVCVLCLILSIVCFVIGTKYEERRKMGTALIWLLLSWANILCACWLT